MQVIEDYEETPAAPPARSGDGDFGRIALAIVLPIVLINLMGLGFVYISLNNSINQQFENLSLRVEDKLVQLGSETLQRATQNGFAQGQQFALDDLREKSSRPDCPTIAIGPEGSQAILVNVQNPECFQTIVDLAQQIISQSQRK